MEEEGKTEEEEEQDENSVCKRWTGNTCDKETENKVEKLPSNLMDALREFSKNSELKNKLGLEFSNAFIKLKNQEWNKFTNHLSEWEIENTMDI